MLRMMWRSLRSPSGKRSLHLGSRPRLEALEDRYLPSTVTNLLDSGPGSLRDAIATAAAGDTIDFQSGLSGSITLTTGELAINKDLTISGPGSSVIKVSGNHTSRVFDVAAAVQVAIAGLTIADGLVSDFGGGIRNAGTLALDHTLLSGNSATGNSGTFFHAAGGGIYNTGTLTVSDSALSDNSANGIGSAGQINGAGGGIFNAGTLTITTSAFSNNSVSGSSPSVGLGFGGGIYNGLGMTVTDSTFDGNVAGTGASQDGYGGAIWNSGTLDVTGSTLSDNSAIDGGGGISNNNTLSITNSTLTGNSARGGGAIGSTGTLTVTGCTLSNNTASGAIGGSGGGIANAGTAKVSDSDFSGNTANGGTSWGTGGAIDNSGSFQVATLSVSNSLFSGNSASGVTAVGGAIYNEQGRATTTITDSTFSGNSVSSGRGVATGGAIENDFGTLNLTRSTIRDNTAVNGGGIDNHGTMTVRDSTFEGNQANVSGGVETNGSATIDRCTFSGNSSSDGGGLGGFGGSVIVTNSTFTGNSALGGGASGGAIVAFGLILLDSTLSGNSASFGGGLYAPSSGTLVRNTIIAGNTASFGPDVAFTFTSLGHNLIGNGRDGSGYVSTDLVGTTANPIDPKLGPLQDNGGPTQTMALLAGSPALNAGDPNELGVADQRGIVRARGVNVGAYQASPDHLLFLQQPTDTAAGQTMASVIVQVVDQFGNVVAGDNTDTITLSIGTNPGGGTLSGTLTVTVANGVATFSDLSIDLAGTGYTLHATIGGGLPDVDSNPFDIA